MLRIPVRKAIPIAALKPRRAISSRPRKLISATPSTSMSTPMKYLESRYPMSEMACSVVSSCLSGTRAHTMFVNVPSSFMKKNPMNATENRPTARLVMYEAAEPIHDENTETSNMLWSSCAMTTSSLKSSPRRGKLWLRNALKSASGPAMLLREVSTLSREMFFTMPLMIGTTRHTNPMSPPITRNRETAAHIQQGSLLPFMLIFCMTPMSGFAMSETTTAMMMYRSTLLKYQQTMPMSRTAAAISMYFASLSVYLWLFSIIFDVFDDKYRNFVRKNFNCAL